VANERVLTRAGYKVSTAADGEEALRVARETLPDVILLTEWIPVIEKALGSLSYEFVFRG
jgi:DNA-binding response OmpR family regulator